MATRKPAAKKAPPKARSRSAIGKHSRRKGKAFEQDVARELRAIFGDQVKRGWQARQGSDAPDVEGVPGWWIEAKHHHKANVRTAFQQVLEAQKDAARKKDPRAELKPLVVSKDDGLEPLATLRFEDFVELLRCEKAIDMVNAGKPLHDGSLADAAELGRILSHLKQAGIKASADPGSLTEKSPSDGVLELVEEVLRLRSSGDGSLALAQPPKL